MMGYLKFKVILFIFSYRGILQNQAYKVGGNIFKLSLFESKDTVFKASCMKFKFVDRN